MQSTHAPAMDDDTKKESLEDFKVRFNNLLNDEKQYLHEIAAYIKFKDEEKVNYALDKLSELDKTESLSSYKGNEDESLLHITVKYYDNDDLVSKLLELCPGLLLKGRESSDSYRGQTALHIALTKGNEKAARKMVKGEKLKGSLPKLLETKAVGKMFVNTVMMGELPLAVAFLKFDPVLVELLLDSGAKLHAKNSHGDSILHTLVKYAAIHPEKIQQVKEMFTLINSKYQKPQSRDTIKEDPDQDSYLWFLQNNDHLTPLQLAAMHGVSELFEFILNLKDVYYIVSGHDGLFDVKMYDITEIDNSTYLKSKSDPLSSCFKNNGVDPVKEGLPSRSLDTASTGCYESNLVETESVLEMLFSCNYQSKDAYRIIELLPIKSIVKLKWAKYRCLFWFWLISHFVVMSTLTVYSVERATYFSQVEMGNSTYRPREEAIHITRWIFLLYGIIYGAIAVSVSYTKYKTHNARRYIFHNLEYIILLVAFAVTIIIDTSMGVQLNTHNSEALIVALICGWWFSIFFLRPFKIFSFFTEMIKRVIVGDMLRFVLVISFELIAFATGMHILFKGVSDADADDFQTYGSSLMAMFKLGIGIADIEVLYVARVPWLAVTLFLLFAILTYILMINALIAMMSQTCALVLQEPYPQWRVQQLSVILFLENILSLPCLRRFLSSLGEPNTKKGKRYFLKIHSLQMEYASEEDKEMVERRKSSVLRKLISKIVKQQPDDRPTVLEESTHKLSRIHKSQRTLEFVDGGFEIVLNNKTTQIKPLSGYRFVRTRNRKRKHLRRRSI